MASITNENAVANIQVTEQETTSPQKPAILSPATKAVFTPSTEAESPDAVATPEIEEEPSWVASALPQIGTASEETETESWVVEAISAELPAEEDLAWMRYLPKLRSDVSMEPHSWIADALSAETIYVSEEHLKKMARAAIEAALLGPEDDSEEQLKRNARVALEAALLEPEESPQVPRPPLLLRSPNYHPLTKAAALSKLAQRDEDSEEGEDDASFHNERQAALFKLSEECATAAKYIVVEEQWRGVLSETTFEGNVACDELGMGSCAMFAPTFAFVLPRGPSTEL